jgi:leucyl aminopeptidase
MKISLHANAQGHNSPELVVIASHSIEVKGKRKSTNKIAELSTKRTEIKTVFNNVKALSHFKGERGENAFFTDSTGMQYLVLGLGDKKKVTQETIRRAIADGYKLAANKVEHLSIDLDSFKHSSLDETAHTIVESLGMTSYVFDKHLSVSKKPKLKTISLDTLSAKAEAKKVEQAILNAQKLTESISIARDFVNEPPNILNSESYAKLVEADAKKLPNVKIKVLTKAMMKKEKMDLFLSVNNGSAFEARVVHLTYTPKKATSKTKHICLVGKGLTFDTGGYSLKPSDSMVNMKFDMAGSATVYAAFRAAALLGADVKITCILGLTDNAVNSLATMPDSIVKARNGKTVEILNTDAEGRLVLADCLDYASDLKPDAIIDAATLTGACLVALGHEMCGLMGNDDKLADKLLKSAQATNEHMWRLPIIEEFSNDIKSPIADLKNMGSNRFGGTSKAAAFLQEFVKPGIAWAHLDIAGIGDSQGYLPYCPAKGASGLIIRTLVHFLKNQK